MYTTLDAEAPAAAFAALSRGITADALILLDGESVTIATLDGIAAEYPGEDAAEIVAGVDAALAIQKDPAEAARWLAVWLDPDLA